MENLHTEITLEILSRLPVQSVLQCKLVCKTWRTLLRLPYFADMHIRRQLQLQSLQRHQLDVDDDDDDDGGGAKVGPPGFFFAIEDLYEAQLYYCEGDNIIDKKHPYYYYKRLARVNHPPIKKRSAQNAIVGSCNGLICFSEPHHDIDDPVYILNPFTREYFFLQRLTKTFSKGYIVNGFGYNPFTNEYKVVRVIYYQNVDQGPFVGHVQVYTLGGGSGWRNKGEIAYKLRYPLPGILANGALHWLDKEWKIVAFDLANEEFHLLPSPPCVHPSREHNYYKLLELGGCLCVVHRDEPRQNLDIWSLKMKKEQDYQSWTREFSIAWEGNYHDKYEPFALTKSGEVLLRYNFETLCLHDPKTATITKLVDDDMGSKYFEAIPHINSFVSLKALEKKSRRRRRICKLKEY
ncbi:F-box domain [Macleaya cordata]|uniref:F-box domain n=1 Tax=Macleaya cordata TaxID=56857 RepID=A0A200Q9W3_MACCD|nr:F-box domain [Macleaya cordata]